MLVAIGTSLAALETPARSAPRRPLRRIKFSIIHNWFEWELADERL